MARLTKACWSWGGCLALTFLLLLALPDQASACSCADGRPPCQGVDPLRASGGAVFVGTVVNITGVQKDIGRAGQKDLLTVAYKVRLTIGEAFTVLNGKEVEVTTAGSTAACGYDFARGERYLVYADAGSDQSLAVSLCSRTRALAQALDDVELLRAAARGTIETRIFGVVRLRTPEGGSAGDQQGRKIVATGGGQEHVTVTDAQGAYRFRGLPLGQYSLRAWLNDRFDKEAPFEAMLTVEQTCAEANFHFIPGARVAGTLQSSDGKPVARMTVVIKDVGLPKEYDALNAGLFWVMTDMRGRYEIEGIPPGRYAFGLHPSQVASDAPSLSIRAS